MFIDEFTYFNSPAIEQSVDFGYIYHDKSVSAYMMYISYVVNNQKYYYSKIQYVKAGTGSASTNKFLLLGDFIKCFADFSYIYNYKVIYDYIDMDNPAKIVFITNVLIYALDLADYLNFDEMAYFVSDVFNAIEQKRNESDKTKTPIDSKFLAELTDKFSINFIVPRPDSDFLNSKITKSKLVWLIAFSYFILNKDNVEKWIIFGTFDSDVELKQFPFLVYTNKSNKKAFEQAKLELDSKANRIYENYPSENYIRIDKVPVPFLNSAVVNRLSKNNVVFLKDLGLLSDILNFNPNIFYTSQTQFSVDKQAGTLYLQEKVKKLFSSMKIPNPIQQLNISTLSKQWVREKQDEFDKNYAILLATLELSRDAGLFLLLRLELPELKQLFNFNVVAGNVSKDFLENSLPLGLVYDRIKTIYGTEDPAFVSNFNAAILLRKSYLNPSQDADLISSLLSNKVVNITNSMPNFYDTKFAPDGYFDDFWGGWGDSKIETSGLLFGSIDRLTENANPFETIFRVQFAMNNFETGRDLILALQPVACEIVSMLTFALTYLDNPLRDDFMDPKLRKDLSIKCNFLFLQILHKSGNFVFDKSSVILQSQKLAENSDLPDAQEAIKLFEDQNEELIFLQELESKEFTSAVTFDLNINDRESFSDLIVMFNPDLNLVRANYPGRFYAVNVKLVVKHPRTSSVRNKFTRKFDIELSKLFQFGTFFHKGNHKVSMPHLIYDKVGKETSFQV
jgi:hypothetical protein